MRLAAAAIVIAGILLLQLYPRDTPSLDYIDLPDGFRISVYADVPNARSLAAGDDGVVFVSNRRADSIYAVVPRDNGAPEVIEVLSGLDSPNGIAFEGGSLVRLTRLKDVHAWVTSRHAAYSIPGVLEKKPMDAALAASY